MNKLTNLFGKIKNVNDEMFLKVEKITIVNKSKIYIQNYGELHEINDDMIKLSNMTITGKNLKIMTISKYFLEVTGMIFSVNFRGDMNEEKG